MLWRIGLGLLVAGGICLFIGFMEAHLRGESSATPEEISLKALLARGGSGNRNIILKDYQLCENYVYEEKNNAWTGAWVPVVPSDEVARAGQPFRPTNVRALIYSGHVRSGRDVETLLGQPRLKALVTTGIMSLGSEEKNLLQSSYPGTDFAQCLIIQEGRTPFSKPVLFLLFSGGVVGLLAGGGLIAFQIVRSRKGTPRRPRRRLADDEDDDEVDRPRRKRRSSDEDDEDDRPQRKRRPSDEDDEDDRPRRRRRT